jgi:hypothetical protein
MKVDGRCHCGRISFEAEIDPALVVTCHCTDCQTLSGAPFRAVAPTKKGSFVLRSGEPKIYVKTADSGNRREQAFCADCGTPIYSALVGDTGGIVSLRVGTIRQRDRLIPTDQYWFRSAQRWLPSLSAMKRTETQPIFRPTGR